MAFDFSNVIHALAARNNPYIPFRNSTLTRILKESLGGNSKASIMVSKRWNFQLFHFVVLCDRILPSVVVAHNLKVQSCKLYNNKYMIALTQITNTEIFIFIAVIVFKLLSSEVLFINRTGDRDC